MKILVVILIILALVSVGILSINQITFSNTMKSVVQFINNIGTKLRDASELFAHDWYLVTIQDYNSLYGTYTFLINTRQRFDTDQDLIINKATIYTNWLMDDEISNVQFIESSVNYGIFQFKGTIGQATMVRTFNNARIRNIDNGLANQILSEDTYNIYVINGGYQ